MVEDVLYNNVFMRGFCVARSTTMGNARASKCGTGK